MRFRLLKTGKRDAAYNMGLDQALSEDVAQGGTPVLRFYGWEPPAISIGYFQKMEAEVDLEKCKELGVDVVRRITGGGAVFHDDELTYSFILPIENELIRKEIIGSYEDICAGIIEGGKSLGLKIKFVPLNDLSIDDQKVSGNAQTRRNGAILQHGTILLSVDVGKMFSMLKVPDEKIKDKMIAAVSQRVTSLSEKSGQRIDFDEAVSIFERGFRKAFPDIEFEPGQVLPEEDTAARRFAAERYLSDDWNFKM